MPSPPTPPTPLEYARRIGVKIGEDNFIADNLCWSSEPYLITIGSHCQISSGVRFLTHGGGQVVRDQMPSFDSFGKIQVGDWVYLGTNSLILPGVTIDDNVLVAAGSVVTKSIPRGVVCAGNPARIICTISDYLERNHVYNTETKGLSWNAKKDVLLAMGEDKFIKKEYMTLDLKEESLSN
ncbi:MAG: acyltransferase [Bacteroidales bacterium]|nr:acyltransferase [Bacteroidales bacterium]